MTLYITDIVLLSYKNNLIKSDELDYKAFRGLHMALRLQFARAWSNNLWNVHLQFAFLKSKAFLIPDSTMQVGTHADFKIYSVLLPLEVECRGLLRPAR